MFNLSVWLSRATLDAIGEGTYYSGYTSTFFLISFSAAFDVRFSTTDNNESAQAFARSYNNIMSVLIFSSIWVFLN